MYIITYIHKLAAVSPGSDSSHYINSQTINWGSQIPEALLKVMPSESSSIPGAGPTFHDWPFENLPRELWLATSAQWSSWRPDAAPSCLSAPPKPVLCPSNTHMAYGDLLLLCCVLFIWGFDCNLTNYTSKENTKLFKRKVLPEGCSTGKGGVVI